MLENLPKPERKYTNEDLEAAKLVLQNSEDLLNSFDLSRADLDVAEAMKAKKAWEDARKKYNEIYQKLNPESKS